MTTQELVERLRTGTGGSLHPFYLACQEAADRFSEMEAENKRLREALEPWAKAAAVLDMPGAAESTGDGQPFEDGEILWGGETGDLTVADFRRARAVYEKTLAALDAKK